MTLAYTLGKVIKSYQYMADFVKQILNLGTHQNYLGNFLLIHLPGLFTSNLLNSSGKGTRHVYFEKAP